ncbi:uncharacterized protein LOC128883053 [Hylaeus volcanicus]|uniref:uncharacterized protein LOC128883053 n=1 Tax=Hylaeus volcanicus TaxID=313075 RepID=UPI0023B7A251|nr:uncharacterized protein LOC128883053 [Hylaeus volcanicus]
MTVFLEFFFCHLTFPLLWFFFKHNMTDSEKTLTRTCFTLQDNVRKETNSTLPRKCFFRQRAHCNPLSDAYLSYPPSPDYVDWRLHYPSFFKSNDTEKLYLNTTSHPIDYAHVIDDQFNGKSISTSRVEILDVGCGYGGLSLALATLYPETLILGMEIREKVTNYLGEKICSLRKLHQDDKKYANVAVIRTNVMKFLVNYFRKGQLNKMFFCYPDPHFKRSNQRRRIISPALLSMYAYLMKTGARIYCVTDVEELHNWNISKLHAHPLFKQVIVSSDTFAQDPCIHAMLSSTEEGNKARRLKRECYSCVFERV